MTIGPELLRFMGEAVASEPERCGESFALRKVAGETDADAPVEFGCILASRLKRSMAVKVSWAALATIIVVFLKGIGSAAPPLQVDSPTSLAPTLRGRPPAHPARIDTDSVPLPAEALARVGSCRLRHAEWINSIAFSEDGKWIVSTSQDGSTRIWEASSGQLCRHFRARKGTPLQAFFLPEGQSLGVLEPACYRVFDLDTGMERLTQLWEAVDGVAVSADRKMFLTHSERKPIRFYDAASGKEITSTACKESLRQATFSPDLRRFASQRDGKDRLKIVSTADLGVIVEMNDGENFLLAPVFAMDGRLLAAVSSSDLIMRGPLRDKSSVCVFDTFTGKLVRKIAGVGASFSPDGKLLAVSCETQPWLLLMDLATWKEERRIHCWPQSGVWAFSPDCKTIALVEDGTTIALFDVQTGRRRSASADPPGKIRLLQFLNGSKSLLVSAGDNTVRDWRIGSAVRRLPDPRMRTDRTDLSCLFSTDARIVAAKSLDMLHMVEFGTGKDRVLPAIHVGEHVESALLSPDGRRLFTLTAPPSSRLCTIHGWDVATGRMLYGTEGHMGPLAISPDGKVLARRGYWRDRENPEQVVWGVVLLDAERGKQLYRWPLPTGLARRLAFSADGGRLAVLWSAWQKDWNQASVPLAVALWDIASGREQLLFAVESRSRLEDVALSPDGRMVAGGYADGTVRLWEVATGKERHCFRGHASPVTHVAFTPDGRLLASASAEAPVYIWDLTGTAGDAAPAPRLSPAERDRLWQALSNSDASAGFQALRGLLASPEDAIALLSESLKPVSLPDPARVRELVRQLNDGAFAVRQNATAELESFGDVISSQLRQSLREAVSAEAKRRLVHLLRKCEGTSPVRLQQMRALELLELVGTSQAEAVLECLANGAAGAWLTHEATLSRDRLRQRQNK